MDDKKSISEWDMQQYLIGELPSKELEAIRRKELRDGEFRARLDALRASHAEIKAKYPTAWTARKLTLAAESEKMRRVKPPAKARDSYNLSWARVVFPALACVAIMIAVPIYMSSTGRPPVNTDTDGAGIHSVRIKGEDGNPGAPILQVWRKTESGPERLAPDAEARKGDILQLWYVVSESCYGTLVSVDGRGVFTIHLAGSDGKAAQLTHGHPVSLPTAYRLDDAPHYEAFYLITSPESFYINEVEQSLKNVSDSKLSTSMNVTTFKLRKLDDM